MTKVNRSDLEFWIHEIEFRGRGLTDWEKTFVKSVKNQLETFGRLNENQIPKLEQIYANKTPLS